MKRRTVKKQMKLVDDLKISLCGGIGRRAGLSSIEFECAAGNGGRRTAQTRRSLDSNNELVIPSQADALTASEGVETRRAAPKAKCNGEGIVQTTNCKGGENRSGKKIQYLHGCRSSILLGGTTYKLSILNPKDEDTESTVKGVAGSWLNIRYQHKTGLGNRLKGDLLLESDLFYLKQYLSDLFIMKKYQYRFIPS